MKFAICALLFVTIWTSNVLGEVASECQGSPADIVFILDSSASIWPNDFIIQKEFVMNVTKKFNIGPSSTSTRVGILTFGHIVQPQFQLKDYLEKQAMIEAIGNIKHMYGKRTETGLAIEYAVNNMFTAKSGSRPDVTQIAVVITDGRSQNVLRTNNAAAAAHKAGIKVFAIGVGKRLDFDELKRIASDPDTEYVFNVDNYRALLSITHRFVTETCKATARPTIPIETTTPLNIQDLRCEGKPADIFFLIDGSSSIDHKDFNKELDFVQKVIKMFDVGPTATRFGMLTFSSDSKMLIRLDNDMDKDTLIQEVLSIDHIGGGTDTARALRMARREGFARSVGRPNVPKIAIVLTDGLSANEDETTDEAKIFHQAGITTFAIGIGYGVDLIEIKAIATDPDDQYVFEVEDFNSLDSIKSLLVNKACAIKPSEVKDKPNDQPACEVKKNTDLMFIYDTSSMGQAQSMAISRFLAKIVAQLDISGGHLHIGRVTENCPSGANLPLSDKLSELDFSNVRFSDYATMIKSVRRAGFNAENGGHAVSNNMGVLFIDSRTPDLNGNTLEEAKALSKVSDVFVVSIGRSRILNQFSSQFNRGNVLSINSYIDLERSADRLLAMFCNHVQNQSHRIIPPVTV